MIEQISWLATLASLAGTALNIKKQRACFYIWSVTNAFWCIYDFTVGAYAQAALFGIYFCLAIWGIYEWKRGGDQ